MEKRFTVTTLFLLCFLFCLFGCDRHSEVADDNSEMGSTKETYALSVIDGEYYLLFSTDKNIVSSQIGSISFDSVDAMLAAIKNNRFEDWQYDIMRSSFPKDKNGIRIFDINHAVDAALPEGLHVDSVDWLGKSYSMKIQSGENDGLLVFCHILWQEDYVSHFAMEYEDRLDQKQLTVTKRQTMEDRNAEVIFYQSRVATLKSVRYSLPNGVIVEERYVLTNSSGFEGSETVPSMINLYGGESEPYFSITIMGLKERPNVEWLSQFGVKERVGK